LVEAVALIFVLIVVIFVYNEALLGKIIPSTKSNSTGSSRFVDVPYPADQKNVVPQRIIAGHRVALDAALSPANGDMFVGVKPFWPARWKVYKSGLPWEQGYCTKRLASSFRVRFNPLRKAITEDYFGVAVFQDRDRIAGIVDKKISRNSLACFAYFADRSYESDGKARTVCCDEGLTGKFCGVASNFIRVPREFKRILPEFHITPIRSNGLPHLNDGLSKTPTVMTQCAGLPKQRSGLEYSNEDENCGENREHSGVFGKLPRVVSKTLIVAWPWCFVLTGVCCFTGMGFLCGYGR
jgi:hypothetical protein